MHLRRDCLYMKPGRHCPPLRDGDIDMASPELEDAAFSIDRARAYLGGLSRRKIYTLLADGTIAGKKLGGRTVILKASCDAYLAAAPDYRKAA